MSTIPRTMYHGTSREKWKQIRVDNQIKPRGNGSTGNWDDQGVPSNPECVYLTDCYPAHFANVASTGGEDYPVILEINTFHMDESLFLPDEDALEQASRGAEVEFMPLETQMSDMKTRTMWFRENINMFSHLAEQSISFLGTVAYYGPIRIQYITRWSMISPVKFPILWGMVDPCITILNRKICGKKYQAHTKAMLGGQVDPWELMMLPGRDAYLEMVPENHRAALEKELKEIRSE